MSLEMQSVRAQIKRGRTGCFTCRRRRKKCDEAKPECVSCLRSGYVCEGYPALTRFPASRRKTTANGQLYGSRSPDPSTNASDIDNASQVVRRQEAAEEEGGQTNTARNAGRRLSQHDGLDWNFPSTNTTSVFSAVAAALSTEMPLLSPPDVWQQNSAAFGDGESTRLSMVDGSDGTFWIPPWSPGLLGYVAEMTPMSSPAEAILEQPGNTPAPNPRTTATEVSIVADKGAVKTMVPRGLPFLIDGINTPAEQRFFIHFATTTSWVMTVENNEHNPVLSKLLPRSLHDEMVRNAILCLGASHLLKLATHPSVEWKVQKEKLLSHTEQEQSKRIALARQRGENAMPPGELDAIISCSLLLCLYEISEGSGDESWRIQLDVARDFIQRAISKAPGSASAVVLQSSAMSPSSPTSLEAPAPERSSQSWAESLRIDEFLLEFFMYHDMLATVTDIGRQPILQSLPDVSQQLRRQCHRTYMLGVDNGLFALLSKVATLRARARATRSAPLAGDDGVLCSALVLWEELNHWQVALAASREAHTDSGDKPDATKDNDQAYACSAYVAALFVWLYSIVYPRGITDSKVREAIAQGMADMNALRGTGWLALLLFPTFVLGCASVTAEERALCSEQFRRLHRFSGMGNVELAHNVVQLAWREYDAGVADAWDWVQQMTKHSISLPVT